MLAQLQNINLFIAPKGPSHMSESTRILYYLKSHHKGCSVNPLTSNSRAMSFYELPYNR